MESTELDSAETPQEKQPRMRVFYGIMAAVSLSFSYLGAYALSGVMVANNLIKPWNKEHDPRPWWLLAGFSGLMALFMIVGVIFRGLSRRQLKRIDAMSEE